MATSKPLTLLDLPPETLVNIFQHLTTPSFVQATVTCHQLFDLAAASRDVVLHHLCGVPGIKLGLEDRTLPTSALFLILRQRASANLYGANFHADCRDLRFSEGTLDCAASCLADTTDHTTISLVVKESAVVRHYRNEGSLNDLTSSYGFGSFVPGKLIQVVHWKSAISILYESAPYQPSACTSCVGPCPVRPTSKRRGQTQGFHPRNNNKDEDQDGEDPAAAKRYYLVHFNAYAYDEPYLFRIPLPGMENLLPRPPLVPIHLTVYNRLKCAILWGEPSKSNSKGSPSEVVLYASDRLPGQFEEGSYQATILYPLRPPSKARESDSPMNIAYQKNVGYLAMFKPRAIAFFEGGQKIKLYRAGSITPYGALCSSSSLHAWRSASIGSVPRTTNEVYINSNTFRVDNPFFGQHIFETSPGDVLGAGAECTMVYLHLATTVTRSGSANSALDAGAADLYILQNRVTVDADDCTHLIELDEIGRNRFGTQRVVARLWGWSPSLSTNSSLTALDSVCVSPNGTRIAIACWDRILIWPLHSDIFCEEWVNEERDSFTMDQVSVSGGPPGNVTMIHSNNDNVSNSTNSSDVESASGASSHGDDAASGSGPNSRRAMVKATRFYDLIRHPRFGEIVELKPIVLKLPGGAIARKMMWNSSTKDSLNEAASKIELDFGLSEGEDDNEGPRTPISSDSESALPVNGNEAVAPLPDADSESHSPFDLDDVRLQLEIANTGRHLEEPIEDEMERRATDVSTTAEIMDEAYSQRKPDTETVVAEESRGARNSEAVPCPVEPNPGIVKQHAKQNDDRGDRQGDMLGEDLASTPPSDLHPTPQQEAPTPMPSDAPPASHEPESNRQSAPESPSVADAKRLNDVLDALTETEKPEDSGHNHYSPPPFSLQLSTPISRTPPGTRSPSRSQIIERGRRLSFLDQIRPPKRKRESEDELVVLTDRGVQLWNLGPWAKGRRETGLLETEKSLE